MHLGLCTLSTGCNQYLKSSLLFILIILKATLCQLKKVKLNDVWVPRQFSATTFNLQIFLFILTIKNNVKLAMQKPFDVNLLIKLRRTHSSSQILEQKILECIKLVELLVQIIGLVAFSRY
jgi:hypothetical protein